MIAIGIGGLVVYVTGSTFSMTYKEAVQTASSQAMSSSRSLSMFITDQKSLARVLSQHRDMYYAVQGAADEAQVACESIVKATPNLWGVVVFDDTGTIVAAADKDGVGLVGTSVASKGYFKDVMAGNDTGVIDDSVDIVTGTTSRVLTVSYPIRDDWGQISGGISLLGSWDAFVNQFIAPISIGEEGYGFVLDKAGVFIQHPDPEQFRRDVSGLEFVKQALAVNEGVIEYDWQGREKVLAVSTEPTTGWTICMSAYVEDIAAGAVRQRTVMQIVGVIMVASVMLLVHMLLARFVFRPVKRTMRLAEDTARGDLAELFEKKENGDEIAHMQSALIDIRRTVRAMIQDLADVAGRIEQGHLHDRAKADQFEGDYARLMSGTNHMLNGLVLLLDELPLPLMAISKDHKINFMNKAAAGLGNTTSQALVGTTCSEYFKSGDCSGGNCACDKAMQGREMVFSNTEANPGRVMEIEYFGMPLLDQNGEVLGAMKVVMDQTEIRRAQREMLETATQADSVASMLSAASQELAAQVEQTTAGADRQKGMAEQVASTMEEMSATVMAIARNASAAARSAEEMSANAERGGEAVSAVVESIEQLRQRAVVVDENIRALGGDVESIGAIMTVISDIADQTNLLALNAAIEAARAGEAGRGFAVVADEVRKLAEKTMNATQEVGEAIQSIQGGTRRNLEAFKKATEAIDQSTALSSKAGEVLNDILNIARIADEQIRSIAAASEQQAAATGEVSMSVEEVNTVSNEIAGSMNESTTAVTDLARLAEELQQITMRIGDVRAQ
ncbi:methyl-accepting chemotaxis protein [Pseudodesulfovibrio portus]|uniref:methyl-accepting chemotaxis protein n=1 Tax=Pseudodesulfovibrio portus TaxID=231439 RepID=UPI00222F0B56|nr:methyl-accepting chemotaxis protein [Pseudodesulfovibrio portus]